MIDYCSECTYLKIDGDKNYGKFWCENMKEWKYASSKKCDYYCDAYSRRSSDANAAYKYSEDSKKPDCYLTTIICDILAMDDNNIYLNNMRSLRNNYLQKNEKGLEILLQYDIVGPQISKLISSDSGKFNIAYTLFNKYISPITLDIIDKRYEDAIIRYQEMTNKLIKYYNLDNNFEIGIDKIEPSLSGHGVLHKKLA